MAFGYLIELKYVKRGELTEERLNQEIAEAKKQLLTYRQDQRLQKIGGKITWICPILVFHGWEMAWCSSVETKK